LKILIGFFKRKEKWIIEGKSKKESEIKAGVHEIKMYDGAVEFSEEITNELKSIKQHVDRYNELCKSYITRFGKVIHFS